MRITQLHATDPPDSAQSTSHSHARPDGQGQRDAGGGRSLQLCDICGHGDTVLLNGLCVRCWSDLYADLPADREPSSAARQRLARMLDAADGIEPEQEPSD